MIRGRSVRAAVTLLSVVASAAVAAPHDDERAYPIKIADNVYDVGGPGDVTTLLITTREGDILIDGGSDPDAADIRRNIGRLGVKLTDLKILLNTQAHFDHASGLAKLKEITGAKVMISVGDVTLVEGGGHGDYLFGDRFLFPAVHVDRQLKDGDRISLGGITLTAHLTPGHTPGCTTFTFGTTDRGKSYRVVMVGGPTINSGARLIGMTTYPTIARDFARTFEVLRSLPCDIFLGAHRSYYDGEAKAARLSRSDASNPFVDPDGYRSAVHEWQAAFEKQLNAERRRQLLQGPFSMQ